MPARSRTGFKSRPPSVSKASALTWSTPTPPLPRKRHRQRPSPPAWGKSVLSGCGPGLGKVYNRSPACLSSLQHLSAGLSADRESRNGNNCRPRCLPSSRLHLHQLLGSCSVRLTRALPRGCTCGAGGVGPRASPRWVWWAGSRPDRRAGAGGGVSSTRPPLQGPGSGAHPQCAGEGASVAGRAGDPCAGKQAGCPHASRAVQWWPVAKVGDYGGSQWL